MAEGEDVGGGGGEWGVGFGLERVWGGWVGR